MELVGRILGRVVAGVRCEVACRQVGQAGQVGAGRQVGQHFKLVVWVSGGGLVVWVSSGGCPTVTCGVAV